MARSTATLTSPIRGAREEHGHVSSQVVGDGVHRAAGPQPERDVARHPEHRKMHATPSTTLDRAATLVLVGGGHPGDSGPEHGGTRREHSQCSATDLLDLGAGAFGGAVHHGVEARPQRDAEERHDQHGDRGGDDSFGALAPRRPRMRPVTGASARPVPGMLCMLLLWCWWMFGDGSRSAGAAGGWPCSGCPGCGTVSRRSPAPSPT